MNNIANVETIAATAKAKIHGTPVDDGAKNNPIPTEEIITDTLRENLYNRYGIDFIVMVQFQKECEFFDEV